MEAPPRDRPLTRKAVPLADRPRPSKALLVVAVVFAVAAAVSIAVFDQPVARWISGYQRLAFWDQGLLVLEWGALLPVFTWAFAILLVVGMVVTLAVPRWRYLMPAWAFVAATHLLSRIAMLEVKLATERMRPKAWLEQGGDTFLRELLNPAFPSGHVVSFASLVIPTVVLFPRAKPLLLVVAYVMTARIVANAHWVSDTLAAISLTCLVTWACAWVIRPLRG
ncbi:MAG: phosphatase PAP2 family protein [Kofleriaceae bacterium]|nr:phosphatase PAP2 family protein [Kofleriaceae bacterium]